MYKRISLLFTFPAKLANGELVITSECKIGAGHKLSPLIQTGLLDACIGPELNFSESLFSMHLILTNPKLTRTEKWVHLRHLIKERLHCDAIEALNGAPNAILTIAANLRTRKAVMAQLERSLDAGIKGWLMVSGGGLPWRNPRLKPWQPLNSIDLLQLATEFKATHGLEGYPQMAVVNPYKDDLASIMRKVQAGAEALITQPAVLPEQFQQWWYQIQNAGLTREARFIIGIPYAPSAEWFKIWLTLVRLESGIDYMLKRPLQGEEANRLFTAFDQAESSGTIADYSLGFTRQRMRDALLLPDVAGIHFYHIPLSKLRRLLEETRVSMER